MFTNDTNQNNFLLNQDILSMTAILVFFSTGADYDIIGVWGWQPHPEHVLIQRYESIVVPGFCSLLFLIAIRYSWTYTHLNRDYHWLILGHVALTLAVASSPDVSLDFVSGNIRTLGKTKLTVSLGSDIKCMMMMMMIKPRNDKNLTIWSFPY